MNVNVNVIENILGKLGHCELLLVELKMKKRKEEKKKREKNKHEKEGPAFYIVYFLFCSPIAAAIAAVAATTGKLQCSTVHCGPASLTPSNYLSLIHKHRSYLLTPSWTFLASFRIACTFPALAQTHFHHQASLLFTGCPFADVGVQCAHRAQEITPRCTVAIKRINQR